MSSEMIAVDSEAQVLDQQTARSRKHYSPIAPALPDESLKEIMPGIIEMVAGVGKSDTSYAYVAFRPTIATNHSELIVDGLDNFTETTECEGTTEFSVRNSGGGSKPWAHSRALLIKAAAIALGYEVTWLNPYQTHLVLVDGPDNIFNQFVNQPLPKLY